MHAEFEWTFSKEERTSSVIVENNGKDIRFHPTYSTGTAAVRGDTPLLPKLHHYWEVRMGSVIFGTDVSVGIGTKSASYNSHERSFVTLIGIDDQSWGYSYTGYLHHNDSNGSRRHSAKAYGPHKWTPGAIIGIHLDGWSNKLEFYLNRIPLGVAFAGLPKNEPLYPMIASTAAKSEMRLLCSQSHPCSLAFECVRQKSQHFLGNLRNFVRPRNVKTKGRVQNKLIAKNNFTSTSEMLKAGYEWAINNDSWIQTLPPGLKSLIDQDLWYLVGARKNELSEYIESLPLELDDSDDCTDASMTETGNDKLSVLKSKRVYSNPSSPSCTSGGRSGGTSCSKGKKICVQVEGQHFHAINLPSTSMSLGNCTRNQIKSQQTPKIEQRMPWTTGSL